MISACEPVPGFQPRQTRSWAIPEVRLANLSAPQLDYRTDSLPEATAVSIPPLLFPLYYFQMLNSSLTHRRVSVPLRNGVFEYQEDAERFLDELRRVICFASSASGWNSPVARAISGVNSVMISETVPWETPI